MLYPLLVQSNVYYEDSFDPVQEESEREEKRAQLLHNVLRDVSVTDERTNKKQTARKFRISRKLCVTAQI